MASINKVLLIGRAGKDPEIRVTGSGLTTAAFSLATGRTYTSKQGRKEEETEWHKIKALGKTAEFCRDYLHKGALVYIEGRLSTSKWEDRDGVQRSTTEIVVERLELLESKKAREAVAASTGAGNNVPAWDPAEDDKIPF